MSMFLHRSLQKGRDRLLGAYKLGPPQRGHITCRTGKEGFFMRGELKVVNSELPVWLGFKVSAAKRQVKHRFFMASALAAFVVL